MGKQNFSEEDMYPHIAAFFEERGFSVSAEVKSCDVVATKSLGSPGEIVIVAELKRSFGLILIYQALRRQRLTPHVFVCVPRPRSLWGRSFSDMLGLIKQLGLGLLMVSMDSDNICVSIASMPQGLSFSEAPDIRLKPPRKLDKRASQRLLKEVGGRSQNLNQGGSVRKLQHTAYREAAIRIACALESYGATSPHRLVSEHSCRQDCREIMYQNTYGWFERPSKGIYTLSSVGRTFLEENLQMRTLITYYREYYNKTSN